MNQSDANKLIEQRLTALYAGGLKIIRQNAPITRQAESASYAKLYIEPIVTTNPFLGGIKSRRIGMVQIDLFTPIGAGNRTITTEAEVMGEIFNNQSFAGIVFYASTIRDIGAVALEDEDIRRYKVNVTIPYYYDKETV